jgi:hypothetical protein
MAVERVTAPLPEADALRRQLEGALEQVEEALAHHRALAQALAGWAWRARAAEWRPLVQAVLDAQAPLAAALGRIERRAQQEAWDAGAPPLRALGQLAGVRARLEAVVQERLAELALPRLQELPRALSLLAARAAEPSLPPLRPGERLLMEGGPSVGWLRAAQASGVLSLQAGLFALLSLPLGAPAAAVALAGAGVTLALGAVGLHVAHVRRSGRYTLTSERLFWQPAPDVLRQAALAEVPLGALRLERASRTVHLGEALALQGIDSPEALAARLALASLAWALGGAGVPEGVTCDAVLRTAGAPPVAGTALLRREGVLFLPAGSAPALFARLVGAPAPVPVPEVLLLETLAGATGSVLGRRVAPELPAVGGALFPRGALAVAPGAAPLRSVHLEGDGVRLACTLPAGSVQRAHGLLHPEEAAGHSGA